VDEAAGDRLARLLAEAQMAAVEVYGAGTRVTVKSNCARCAHPIHRNSFGWVHDSFSGHDAELFVTWRRG
jgi:hypothetical protein